MTNEPNYQRDGTVKNMSDRWCILRMAPTATTLVASSLTEGGYDVWTPVVIEKKRTGLKRKEVSRPVPLAPGIVFARADRLHDLVTMSRSPALTFRRWNAETKRMEQRGCPHFRVFRDQGRFPLIADHQLEPLRKAEWRGRPRKAAHVFAAGDAVSRPEVNFSGMIGIIQTIKRQKALVLFPGATNEVVIELCDLVPVEDAAA